MDDVSNERIYNSHLRKLGRFARRLLSNRRKGPADMWKFQVDLVEYQLEIRKEINRVKDNKADAKSKIVVQAKLGRE